MVNGIRCYYDDEELDGLVPVIEGCARAQGYTKMGVKEKRLHIRRADIMWDCTKISETVNHFFSIIKNRFRMKLLYGIKLSPIRNVAVCNAV